MLSEEPMHRSTAVTCRTTATVEPTSWNIDWRKTSGFRKASGIERYATILSR